MSIVNCKTIHEVREKLDDIDERIIRLLALRNRYVKQAAQFKRTKEKIKNKSRVDTIIENVKNISKIHGVDPWFIEKLYRVILNHFIDFEIKEVNKK